MKKALKAALSCLLTLCLLLTPFSGVLVFASSEDGPTIRFSIAPLCYVTPDTAITVTYSANGDATLASCDTRLEGISLGTAETVTFTPADRELTSGVYTLVGEATDSNGATTIDTVSFVVTNNLDISFSYAGDESIVPSVDGATASYHAVTPLDYTMGYGTTANGNVALEDALSYDALTAYNMQYLNVAVENRSTSGIPYQTFDVALNGKTDGEVVVRYSGSTLTGERIALKAYNPVTAAWDTLGTFTGIGSVSASVDVATYADNDAIHVMAILDYVTNGSDTMIWSTDPQHYTKFDDLNEYYYQIYQYAAAEYLAGNVGYIMTTGDIVDDLPSTTAAVKQWEVADKAMSYVDEVGMPNGLVSGNHDVKTVKIPNYENGDADVDYSKYLQYFSADRYNDQPWYGGSLNNNISHYDLITIGNVDFIIMYLGYGVEATDETIAWANDVLQTYRHRTAIITTHQYLDAATADRSPASRAQLIFDTIIDPNPNVKAILCGHDDGSIVNEVTASDGRTVYELLSDYQFVEAEDPDFYANEHYIGSVPSCCGDGYIRLMTVEGSTLSSITYSPVTGKYNPYGDRENISIDLNCGVPNRALASNNFSSYVLGEEISLEESWATPSAVVITKEGSTGEEETPAVVNEPATPENPYYAHAASYAPNVEYKTDLLKAAGLSDNTVNTAWTPYQNLNLNVDLTKTPYLYYSIDVPADGNFTFALVNNTNYAPWLVFRDATGEGAYLNNGNANWDSYTAREQYITASETGCVDMRTISTDPNKATWIVAQLTMYNSQAKGVTVNYMFFGSEPIEQEAPTGTADITTYHHVSYTNWPEAPEAGTNTPVDLAALEALIAEAEAMDLTPYTEQSREYLAIVLGDMKELDKTLNDEVSPAYFLLTRMLGAMKEIEVKIDPATLQSIHNYDMTPSKWATSDTTKTALDVGFKLSRNTQNGWASVNNAEGFQIKSNNGKIYLNLDVEADCAWSIHLAASQANISGTIVVNHAIDNAFNRINCDSMNGTYKGVYDITEAFTKFGMDPSATISISRTYLYIVPGDGSTQYPDLATNPDTVDYRYVEFMTDVASGEDVDKTELEELVAYVNTLDSTLYTTGTWNAVQQAMVDANNALNSTDLVQADLNLVTLKLQNAVNKLKLLTDVIEEPEGSLLPADESKWVQSPANSMNIYRNDEKYTVLQNTNNQWPSATYTYPEALTYTVADHQIAVDITVASQGRIDLLINNQAININKYITNKLDGGSGDMLAGTYTANIPLSDIITDSDTAVIKSTQIFAIGNSDASAVTVRQLQIVDYVAPPPVEDVRLDMMPENDEEWTLVAGEGTVTVENGVLTAVNNSDGDLRITLDKKDFFDLTTLNSLHMQFNAEMPFKMAFHVVGSKDSSGSAWPNTSTIFGHIFDITDDRAAAGEYDVQLEMRDNCASITDKSSVYFDQFIILLTGKGTFTLNVAEMIAYDNFDWPEEGFTYGEPATPDNPYYAHAAQKAPEVAEKYDLLKAIGYSAHPTITAWTAIGNQASDPLGLEIDISKTPYLYYSFAVPTDGNFTFAMYGNSNYCPWLSFLDSTAEIPFINQGAANWDAYTQREQYSTTSQTGCIDMRPLLKNPDVLKWVVTQINFYNSTGKEVILSYFFFGSEPIENDQPCTHEGLVHMDAVEPGCHMNGNIEHWVCYDCETFWADEALTQITNSKNVILPATGEGNLVHFDAVEPGCHYNGNIEYWYCSDCETFWADEALTQITNSKLVILPAVGSENLVHVEAVAPTATENGNVEYWHCPDCDGYWLNEDCTLLTNRLSVILPATGEVVEGLLGDVNCDGEVNLTDATLLFYYVNGQEVNISVQGMQNADVTGDTAGVDLSDATKLFYYINGSIEE